MIDENKTFILFGYTSESLLKHSHKKILCICDCCKSERLTEYRKYTDLCFKCSHETKEYKSKQSEALLGEKSPMWKGGKILSKAKSNAKRRKCLGFISHNIPHENFHGHHLDFNHVIFIPKELHMSIPHSVINNKNMNLINNAVCDWYLKYQLTYL